MSSVARTEPGRGQEAAGRRATTTTVVWVAYGLLGFLLLAFIGSRLARPAGSYWSWLDGWVVDGIELGGSLLCLARGVLERRGRLAALTLGFALLAWCAGDFITTVESFGGATPAEPSWADALYLGSILSLTSPSCCICGPS